jgi:hypothetical protein
MQHHQFAYKRDQLRQICIEFLVICNLLSQKLFGVNLVTELMFDPWTESADPMAEYLPTLAWELSFASRPTVEKMAADWLARNPAEQVMLCINCGSRTFVLATGFCTACGAEGDERASTVVEELEEISRKMRDLR